MTFTPSRKNRLAWLAALAAVAIALAGAAATDPAEAAVPARAPGGSADDEGGTSSLRKELDTASRGYLDAKAALGNSTKREKELAKRLTRIEADLEVRNRNLGRIVGKAYRNGRLGPVSALLNSDSPEGFLDRAAALGTVAANEDKQLRELFETRDQVTRSKAAIANEIREQRKQLTVMEQRRKQAERALAVAAAAAAASPSPSSSTSGSSGSSSGSTTTSGSASATPAPRNADGSWPGESCSIDDPTTSGCITPRTLHALNQAKAAGYTRYVSCFRSGGSGEHPKGRACDFAAAPNTFGGVATGADKAYGDSLANYFINNADRLGVLYVIWYKRIWLPSSGWKTYSGAGGDPSSDHTNHVHLSMY